MADEKNVTKTWMRICMGISLEKNWWSLVECNQMVTSKIREWSHEFAIWWHLLTSFYQCPFFWEFYSLIFLRQDQINKCKNWFTSPVFFFSPYLSISETNLVWKLSLVLNFPAWPLKRSLFWISSIQTTLAISPRYIPDIIFSNLNRVTKITGDEMVGW